LVDCHIDIETQEATSHYLIHSDAVRRVMTHLLNLLSLQEREVSLSFVSDAAIQQINAQYRNRNQPTDVLSFPQQEWKKPLCLGEPVHAPHEPYPQPLGDIVISLEQAEQNAKEIGHGLDRETCFLLIHGLLHLCGHDHEKPEEELLMCAQQQKLLTELQEQAPVPWLNMVTRKEDST
jgi:probable rRNA maturation factor